MGERHRLGPTCAIVLAAVLVLAGCGGGADDATIETDGTSVPDPDPAPAPDGDGDVDGEPAPPDDDDAASPPPTGGLGLRVTGVLVDGLLCPGGQRPCLAIEGDVEPDQDDGLRVVGRLIDGVLVVIDQEPVPPRIRSFPDRCEGKIAGAGDREETFQLLEGYRASIADRYAVQWVSTTNVFHFGVTGDAADVEQAIADLGLDDRICVVGGFERSEQELQAVSAGIGRIVDGWDRSRLEDAFGWAADPFEGTVSMDLYRADAGMVADLGELGDGVVVVNAAIEVLDGSLDDLDEALAGGGASPAPEVTMTCGRVRFPAVPADLDGFEPLDADAEDALDAALAGPAGAEAVFFVDAYEWSIASRTEDELVLFGAPVENERAVGAEGPRYADMAFDRVDGEWVVGGFGQCRLEVSALGLGVATVILDPDREPDPASTELPVLIRERACAGGQAPVDREIVPVVTESDALVEVVVLVAPVRGGATCPSNPWHPITVTLGRALGERKVLDAGVQPGRVRTWPPTEADLNG